MRRVLFLSILILCGAGFGTALAEGDNPEFAKALEITNRTADALQSYDLDGTLVMENLAEGQTEPIKLEVALKGAARWPDRLLSSQESPVFNLHLGLNADQSWFYLGQTGTCYVGPPVGLSREIEGVRELELEESKIFNFYAGIGPFLLNADLVVEPETRSESLTIGGREIACQVFRTVAGSGAGEEEGEKTLWFDPVSGLVVQAHIESDILQQGRKVKQNMTFRLDRFTVNQPVADEVFQFTPPAEARVVASLDRILNPDAMTGEIAEDVVFTDFEGNAVRLSDYRGKVVFLDFWATWCGPCRMEMPHIQKLHEELGPKGDVVFLGASSEAKATIKGFLAKNPYTFKVVMVNQEDAQKKFKVSSIPAGFVIDREGVIRAHLIGAQTENQLRKALERAGIDP